MYEKVCLHHQLHGCIVEEDNFKRWYKEGKLHNTGDQPAVIHTNGRKEWYKE